MRTPLYLAWLDTVSICLGLRACKISYLLRSLLTTSTWRLRVADGSVFDHLKYILRVALVWQVAGTVWCSGKLSFNELASGPTGGDRRMSVLTG